MVTFKDSAELVKVCVSVCLCVCVYVCVCAKSCLKPHKSGLTGLS